MVSTRTPSQSVPPSETHEVTNQVPPLVDYDAADDAALLSGLRAQGAGWAEDDLHRLGRLDELLASGNLDSLLRSLGRFSEKLTVFVDDWQGASIFHHFVHHFVKWHTARNSGFTWQYRIA